MENPTPTPSLVPLPHEEILTGTPQPTPQVGQTAQIINNTPIEQKEPSRGINNKVFFIILAVVLVLFAGFVGFLYRESVLEYLRSIPIVSNYLGGKTTDQSSTILQSQPDIKELKAQNEKIFEYLGDAKVNAAYIVETLDKRKSLLKTAFRKYSYDDLKGIVEEPIFAGLGADPYYAPFIEKAVSKVGKITIYSPQAANPTQSYDTTRYVLYVEESLEYIFLNSPVFNDPAANFNLDVTYKVSGVLLDDEMLVKDIYPYTLASSGGFADNVLGASTRVGTLDLTVIVVKGSSKSGKILPTFLGSVDTIRSRLSEVGRLYKEMSYGKLSVLSKVYEVSIERADEYCALNGVKKVAYLLEKLDYPTEINDGNIVQTIEGCDNLATGGIAYSRQPISINLGNGRKINLGIQSVIFDGITEDRYITITAHEIGHNLGMSHADSSDQYDLMSTGKHFSLKRKEALGWLTQNNVREIKSSQIVTIEPLESETTGILGVKIPVMQAPKEDIKNVAKLLYYVENRASGVHVRLVSDDHSDILGSADAILQGVFQVGDSFYDSVNKITLKITAKNADKYTISITLEESLPSDLDRPEVVLRIQSDSGSALKIYNIHGKVKLTSVLSDQSNIKNHEIRFLDRSNSCGASDECSIEVDSGIYLDSKPYELQIKAVDEYNNQNDKKTYLVFNNGNNLSVSENKYKATYFESLNFLGATKSYIVDNIDFALDKAALPGLENEAFAASFESKMRLSGSYEIKAIHDDGVKVYIDDEEIMNEWKEGDENVDSVNFGFDGSLKTLRVDYFKGRATPKGRIKVEFNKKLEEVINRIGEIITPSNGSSLNASTVTFTWAAGENIDEYYIRINKSLDFGRNDLFNGSGGESTSITVFNLPTDGSTINVRLYSKVGNTWRYNDYSYNSFKQASIPNSKAEILSPANNSTIKINAQSFSWSKGSNVDKYVLSITTNGQSPVTTKEFNENTLNFVYADSLPADKEITIILTTYFRDGKNGVVSNKYHVEKVEISLPPPEEAPGISNIVVFARGESNEVWNPKLPRMAVKVNGKLYSYIDIELSLTSYGQYLVTVYDKKVKDSDEVQIELINDTSNPSSQPLNPLSEADRNVYILKVMVDGREYNFRSQTNKIIYDRANKESGSSYAGYDSFGNAYDGIGVMKYNDSLGFSYATPSGTPKDNFTEEIFWNGAVRIRESGF